MQQVARRTRRYRRIWRAACVPFACWRGRAASMSAVPGLPPLTPQGGMNQRSSCMAILPGLGEAVSHVYAIAAAELAGAAAVGNALVALDDHGEIAFEKLVRDVGEAGPEGVAVRTVAERPAGNAAEADLEQLEPFACSRRSRKTSDGGWKKIRRRRGIRGFSGRAGRRARRRCGRARGCGRTGRRGNAA